MEECKGLCHEWKEIKISGFLVFEQCFKCNAQRKLCAGEHCYECEAAFNEGGLPLHNICGWFPELAHMESW